MVDINVITHQFVNVELRILQDTNYL